jgi:hypothetical protein
MGRTWLNVNEEVTYKKIINCISAVELRNIGKYLHKIRREPENKSVIHN